MIRGIWHETHRLASVLAAWRVCRAGSSRNDVWHCTHIASESASNFKEFGFCGAFEGCGSWHEPHVASPLRKHCERANASLMNVVAR